MDSYSTPFLTTATQTGSGCAAGWSFQCFSDEEIETMETSMRDMEVEEQFDQALALAELEFDQESFEIFMAQAEDEAKVAAKEQRKVEKRERRDLLRFCHDIEEAILAPDEVNPFTPEVMKADLIRCPNIDPLIKMNSLDHLAVEYVRSIRLLMVKDRWTGMCMRDWMKETGQLMNFFDDKPDEYQCFQPLADCRQDLEEFLEAQDAVIPTTVWRAVKKSVEEDCEKRGSLTLMTIPEFVFEAENRRGFTQNWSWYS
ncbi:hypothetical protein T440DRAFT_480398 [Plenodomus tracheiphilus IPT5]|uniref:Uncharacterized protein n=1 Tax=Plenodomus tracheiphilus IPT5 TaxID=1408161 RepID=A0A6A7B263_9PLEO|nr:hypothetical protein T440DRAFT_480398 [Plenodomus tracheiphilus IPT5]